MCYMDINVFKQKIVEIHQNIFIFASLSLFTYALFFFDSQCGRFSRQFVLSASAYFLQAFSHRKFDDFLLASYRQTAYQFLQMDIVCAIFLVGRRYIFDVQRRRFFYGGLG